jgi:outer membrane protein OmpA-like peptidoglycan-associated protein
MPVNLINILRNEFSSDALERIASFVGETPASTQTALGSAIPAVLAGLAQKSQTPRGAEDIFGMLQRGGFSGQTLGTPTGMLTSRTDVADAGKVGAPLISSLFGPRESGVANWIASIAAIRPQSAISLLGLIMPFVLNRIGREATNARAFNTEGVARLLGDQLPFLRDALSPGLASVLGLSAMSEPARGVAIPRPELTTTPPFETQHERGRRAALGWVKWAIPLVILPLILWAFLGRSRGPEREPGTVGTTGLMKQKLACGQELDVAPNGVESQLVAFLDDDARPVDRETWLTFDRLDFQSGSAVLRPRSRQQVRNIAEILRCYPNATVRIGGYTDNVGDPASNLRLSKWRAESTRQAVIRQGISPSRVEAEGYGEQHPVASNATEEGRQRNRRIDVLVTRK